MKRILIVNVNWLGDALFSTPAIRAIRKKYPQSHIACLIPKRCESVLKNNTYLSERIVTSDKPSIFETIGLIGKLRRGKFDTALFFHRSKTKVLLAFLAGIGQRLGWQSHEGWENILRKKLLTRTCALPERTRHRSEMFLDILHEFGIPADGAFVDYFPAQNTDDFDRWLETFGIGLHTSYVVVHAGGNWELKRWPEKYFAEWIGLFLKEFPSTKIVLCGTDSENTLVEEIRSCFERNQVLSLCGQTSLDKLALLLRRAEFILSNDSGPIHLAASQGTKIIGLFGPTSPAVTGPISRNEVLILKKDVGCEIPCYYRSCNYRVCMEWLTPKEVFEKTKQFLTSPSSRNTQASSPNVLIGDPGATSGFPLKNCGNDG